MQNRRKQENEPQKETERCKKLKQGNQNIVSMAIIGDQRFFYKTNIGVITRA
jgi:hypothetical protein